jgi:hypothetical protein
MHFMQVPESAWPALARLSGLQVGIWADAWTWQQQGQRAFRSNDQLAKMFGCNRRSVQRAVQALQAMQLLAIRYQGKMRFLEAFLPSENVLTKGDQSVMGDRSVTVTDVTPKGDRCDAEGRPIGRDKGDQSVTQVYQSKSLSKSPIKSLRLRADLEGEEKGDLHFPWDTDAFLMTWEAYKGYMKKEHRFYFKSQRTEQIALFKISNQFQDEHSAIRAIGQTMANGWKGIPAPKARSGNNRAAQGYSPERDQEAAARGNY